MADDLLDTILGSPSTDEAAAPMAAADPILGDILAPKPREQLIDEAGQAIGGWGLLKRIGSNAYEATTDFFGSLADLPERYINAYGEGLQTPQGQLLASNPFTALATPLASLTPEEQARTIGRGALQTAGGVSFGPLFPLGVGAGGYLWDKLEQFTGTKETSTPEQDFDNLVKETTVAALPTAASKTLAIPQKTRNLYRKIIPSEKQSILAQTSDPDAIVAALKPRGSSAASKALEADLRDATATYLEEQSILYAGVNRDLVNNPTWVKLNPRLGDNEFLKFQNNVSHRITDLSAKKQNVLRDLDAFILSENAPKGMGKVSAGDLGFDKIQELIKKRDLSAITRDSAADLGNILGKLNDDFFHETSIYKPGKSGEKFVLEKSYSLSDANDILNNIYNRLEEAKAFDALTAVNANINPGAIAANADAIFALRAAAGELKNRIGNSAEQVRRIHPTYQGVKIPKSKTLVGVLNDKIHNLIPLRDSLYAFASDTLRARGEPLSVPGSAPSGFFDAIKRPIFGGITDVQTQNMAMGRNAKLLNRLSLTGENYGKLPRELSSLNLFPSQESQALAGASLAASRDYIERQEALFRARDKYGIDLTPFESIDVDGEDIYLEDKNDQADYISFLRSSGAPTYFIAAQSSQFNNPVAPSILLDPPKGKEDFDSEPDIRLKRSESGRAAEYAY